MNLNRQGQEKATISSYKRVRYENYDNYYEDIPRGIAPYYSTPYAEVYRESYRLAAQHDTADSKESMTFQKTYRPTTQDATTRRENTGFQQSYRPTQHDTLDSRGSMTFQESYRPTTQNTMNMKHEESMDFTATGAGHHEMMQALPVNPTISSATTNKGKSSNLTLFMQR